ncbi:MAG TPA: PIN domain-containing protein [Thermogutta sp.]|nr:PIN domain-containing protein [Thermogutta sp.]
MGKRRSVILDTNILVYAIRPDDCNDDRAKRAKDFISDISRDDEADILIPAVVVAEFLCGCDSGFEDAVRNLQEHFKIVPFDMNAACQYRQVVTTRRRRSGSDQDEAKQLAAAERNTVDEMIVATALAARAQELITYDQGLINLAKAVGIDAKEPPELGLGLLPGF